LCFSGEELEVRAIIHASKLFACKQPQIYIFKRQIWSAALDERNCMIDGDYLSISWAAWRRLVSTNGNPRHWHLVITLHDPN
jgi:hypothetical protein